MLILYCCSDRLVVDGFINDMRDAGFFVERHVPDAPFLTKSHAQSHNNNKRVLIFISRKFLESFCCILSAMRMVNEGNGGEIILPIVLSDSVSMFNSNEHSKIAEYWKQWRHTPHSDKLFGKLFSSLTREEVALKYKEISEGIGGFVRTVSDMNYYAYEDLKENIYVSLLEEISVDNAAVLSARIAVGRAIDLESSSDEVEKFRLKYSGSEHGFVLKGMEDEKRGKYNLAVENYLEALSINPGNAATNYRLGDLYRFFLYDFNSAVQAYKNAIELDSYYDLPRLAVGLLMSSDEDSHQQIECIEQAIEINPCSTVLYNSYGDVLLNKHGDSKKAKSQYKKTIALDENNEHSLYMIGVICADYDYNADLAKRYFEKVIEINKYAEAAYQRLGKILLLKKNKIKKNREELEKALFLREADNNKFETFDYYVRYVQNMIMFNCFKDNEKEKKKFMKSEEVDLLRASAHCAIGCIASDVYGEYDIDEDEQKKAIEIHSELSTAHCRLGFLLWSKHGDFHRADEEYEIATKNLRHIPEEYVGMTFNRVAMILNNNYRDYYGAKKSFGRVIEEDPDDAFSYYNLGVVVRDKFGDHQESHRLIDKAISLDSNLIDKIRVAYEEKIINQPGDMSDLYELGIILKNYMGMKSEGQKYIDEVLDKDPDYLKRSIPDS